MRPSIYTQSILDEIVERLSSGEPMAQICRDEGMPSYSTVYSWMQTKEEVSKAIACAREEGEDVIASNTRLIARGTSVESTKDVQRDKLIIDTDLKLLAKWNPKKYGDKIGIGGAEDLPPVGLSLNINWTPSGNDSAT